MFHPLGHFKGVNCPRNHDCTLQNCIFNHEQADVQDTSTSNKAYDPLSAGDSEPPPSKRRKIESLGTDSKVQHSIVQDVAPVILSQRPGPALVVNSQARPPGAKQQISTQVAQPISQLTKLVRPASVKRPISPPPRRDVKASIPEKVEKLIPRPVARAPALLKVRMSFVELLYKQLNALNVNTIPDSSEKAVVPNDQQVIKWVLDEEEQAAAKLGSDIYRNAMSQKILQLKRMQPEDWEKFVNEKFGVTKPEDKSGDGASPQLTPDEEVQVLKYLRTNLTGLDNHGYVNKPPSAVDIQKAKDAIKTAGGYEVCDRCGVRFQVFPGRDQLGRLTTKGECHYHWAKLVRTQWQKTDHITGQAQSSFPCCGQQPGAEGCTQAPTHVFKDSDPKRMAALLQFESTSTKNDGKKRGPIAFDCEMAYTTYGMEVIRVTAVSWPQNQELLDVLVRPYGEILDLNTRFSGVTQEQYTNALPYDASSEGEARFYKEGKSGPAPLRKVDSPAFARELMFALLGPETPLIGHAIDNDLNTCRIIHPFVIDTVLLYPHPRGLPIRYGLRMLASKYLNRTIQNGGAAGHDSKEDSIATGDLVRIKVAEKWQMMRLQGWKFRAGTLAPPGC